MAYDWDKNEEIAIKLMGWKWMTFHGIPVKGAPGYPEECTVKQLFTPEALANPKWQEIFTGEATGQEPLSYTYCSSGFNAATVPNYFEDMKACELIEARLKSLGLINLFQTELERVERTRAEKKHEWRPSPRMLCVAALAAVANS